MIRIRFGMVLRNNEIITLANATITVTDKPITIAGSNLAVTAKAEQIPNTCTVTGLFMLIGAENTSLFFLENNWLIFYFPPYLFAVKNLSYWLRHTFSMASTPFEVIVPPEIPST